MLKNRITGKTLLHSKRILSLALTLCIALTAVMQMGLFNTLAADEEPAKTMLHVVRTSASENKLVQRFDVGSLKENTEYTISLNSKFVTASFGNGVYVGLFAETNKDMYGDTFLRASHNSYGCNKIFSASKVNGANIKFTFTLEEGEIKDNFTAFYVGFYFKAKAEFYVGDLVLYESDDESKTNILPKNEYSADMTGWYNNYFNGKGDDYPTVYANSQYVPYEESYFELQKTMLHVVRTSTSENKLVQKFDVGSLKEGTEYTISLNQKFVTGSFGDGVYVGLFAETAKDMYGDTSLRASHTSYGCKKLFSSDASGSNIKYTFTLDEGEIKDTFTAFYVGFYFKAKSEFYIGDLVLYESADEEKTNILPKNEYSIDMTGWYNNYFNGKGDDYPTVYANSQYVPYDESYFPVHKTMLHVVRTTTSENKLVQKFDVSGIKENTEYTISFDHSFLTASLGEGVYVGLFAETSKDMYGDTALRASHTSFGCRDMFNTTQDGANIKYTFTLNEGEIKDTFTAFYVGFYFKAASEFYVADLVLYESSDEAKTNILPKDEYSLDMIGWYNNYFNGKGDDYPTVYANSQYVPYDASLFVSSGEDDGEEEERPIPTEPRMLHFKNGANTSMFAQLVKADIGDTYILTASVACSVEGIECMAVLNEDRQAFDSETIKSVSETDHEFYTTYTYSITVPETARNGTPMTGYAFMGISVPYHSEGYIFDISVCKANDPKKTELYANADFAPGLDRWTWGWAAWFIDARTGTGLTEWMSSDGGNKLELLEYDLSVVKAYIDSLNFDDGEWWDPKDVVLIDDRGTATVKGTITDQNGAPLSNVQLVLVSSDDTYTAYSNAEGVYVFKSVFEGFYELFIVDGSGQQRATGYFSNFGGGDAVSVDIVSDTSGIVPYVSVGTLNGKVYTPELKTVADIRIYLRGSGDIVTDENGYFEFKDVPVGNYELYTILENGSEYVFRTVSVKENVELSVKLKYDVGTKDAAQNDNSDSNNRIWIAVVLGAAVLIVTGIVLLILIKKKKLSKN